MKKDNFIASSYTDNILRPIFNNYQQYFAEYLYQINQAHAIMLAEENIITNWDAKKILLGLREIENEIQNDSLEYTGEVEDYYFMIENKLIEKYGVEIAGKLHTGRSRNDINITLFKLGLRKEVLSLIQKIISLTKEILNLAINNKETIYIAYTHGQPAQPTTFGHYLASIIEFLLRDLTRLFNSYDNLNQSSMGAAAITTTGFPINRERVAELLGFSSVQENSYGCIAATDYFLEVYSAIQILFISLGRFIVNLDRATAFETDFLSIPEKYVQISSIMPNKRNPVPIEHLRSLSSLIVGHCDTIIRSLQNTPFADINDAEENFHVAGFKVFKVADKVLDLLTDFISCIEVNSKAVKNLINKSRATATEVADSLVRKENISFRQAHQITSKLVKLSNKNKKILGDISFNHFAKIFREHIDREPKIEPEEFRRAFQPEYFIKVRNRFGGPSKDALSKSLSSYKHELSNNEKKHNDLTNSIQESRRKLKNKADELTADN